MASLVLLVGATLGGPRTAGQVTPERLTTETTEYCLHLQDRLHQAERDRGQPLPEEARLLSNEGRLACDHGETRRGILRLRRAMRMVLDPADR